jgi:hypothetical protein
MDGLHLPKSEWRRTGLRQHWRDDDADLESPFFHPQRKVEVWASREDALTKADEPYDFSHLEALPRDSPVLTEWTVTETDEYPDRPPVPFARPKLSVRAVRAEGVTDTQGFDRVVVGHISRVEVLNEISEQPTEPDITHRNVAISPPSRHPEIDYAGLEHAPQSDELLEAVFTINRHAKRFGEQADEAYNRGDGVQARAHALRKRALYRTKTVALHRLSKADPDAIHLVRHELNGDHELFCLSVGDQYSFHQPLDAIEPDLLAAVAGTTDRTVLPLESIAFESSSTTAALDQSLSHAIDVLRDHDIEPNDYLDTTHVTDFTWGTEFSTQF